MSVRRLGIAQAVVAASVLVACEAPPRPCAVDGDCFAGTSCSGGGLCVAECESHGACAAARGAGSFCDFRGRCAGGVSSAGDVGTTGATDAGVADAGPRALDAEAEVMLVPRGSTPTHFGAGIAVSADGSRALIGAGADDTAAENGGCARVFSRFGTAWVEEAVLVASSAARNEWLGTSVALSADGSRALVGAVGVAWELAGSARVFVRSDAGWTEEARLSAGDATVGDLFGFSVALSADGDRALVGAYYDDVGGVEDAGSARVFARTGASWTEEAMLVAADAAEHELFGMSVALSADGSRAVVGVVFDNGVGRAGGGRVFVRDGTRWTEETALISSSLDTIALGESSAMSADGTIAVLGGVQGAVVFVRDAQGWIEEAALRPADATSLDRFGSSVAVSADGRRALVGGEFDDTTAGEDAGSARVFDRGAGGWTEGPILLAPDGAPTDWFGRRVALAGDGRLAVVGAPEDDTAAGLNGGSAWVFRLP